eukprot:COSAG01_NODE_10123_length_2244_cov_1.421445_2_plen_140_part_00
MVVVWWWCGGVWWWCVAEQEGHRAAASCSLVVPVRTGAVELGEGLLKQRDPELAPRARVGEEWRLAVDDGHRHVVVDRHQAPGAIMEETQRVQAGAQVRGCWVTIERAEMSQQSPSAPCTASEASTWRSKSTGADAPRD